MTKASSAVVSIIAKGCMMSRIIHTFYKSKIFVGEKKDLKCSQGQTYKPIFHCDANKLRWALALA